MKINLKPPLTFYGGKQNMLKDILPLIPNHECYIEPFFGGGAVFFAKQPAKVEVINDADDDIIIFYEQIKNNYKELDKLIQNTLHSRKAKINAVDIIKNKKNESDLRRAWALWTVINQGFSQDKQLNYNWIFAWSDNKAKTLNSKKEKFKHIINRLEETSIECWDVLRVIKNWDSEKSFFYVDPPYISSKTTGYIDYSQDQFLDLLNALIGIKGKFLLSTYPEEILFDFRKANNWNSKDITGPVTTSKARGKEKIECLTWNYDNTEDDDQLSLFQKDTI